MSFFCYRFLENEETYQIIDFSFRLGYSTVH